MANVTVINGNINRLLYEAQGFRNAFFIIFNSIMSKDGCESWGQDGDAMSVLGTNGSFALELYLKFLMVVDSFNQNNLSGAHVRGHQLDQIYDLLKTQNNTIITDLENKYGQSSYRNNYSTLRDFLASIKDFFLEWRYSYDSGMLNVNLNTLSDLLNIFENYSLKKFIPVANILAQNPVTTPDNQTMTISNINDIRKL